jgi:RNA polymerase primary sigma factor
VIPRPATPVREPRPVPGGPPTRAPFRLVEAIARSYTGKGLGLEDLIEEGNLGLWRAVDEFDPSLNTRFSTYPGYWIKESIRRALDNTAKATRRA